jgi:Ca-activated chloride channel family protein
MRKVAIFVFLFSSLSLSALASTTVIPMPQATPPVMKNDLPASGQPPVLKGDTTAVPKPTVAPAGDEIIKVSTDLVTTPVSVLDRSGRFIPGLKKKDFKIYENGVLQNITYFQSEEQPFTVVLLIDISPSTKYKMDEIHFAALTFVNQLRANDKVMVVAFDQRIRLLMEEPTSEKQKIYAAIYKATFGSGTSLYEAVSFIADLEMIKVTGRKAVVLFTDGVDTTSRLSNFESSLASVQEVDALIYPIRYNTLQAVGGVVSATTGAPTQLPPDIAALMAARGIALDPRSLRNVAGGSSPASYAKGKLYLERLAEATGGRIFEADDIKDMEAAFAGVAEELRRQYSLVYYPEQEGQPGERRNVKIKIGRPNVVVRAKSGYVIRQTRGEITRPANNGILAAR